MSDIREKLFYEQKNGYDLIGTDERLALEDYCRGYMDFLDSSRMEREASATPSRWRGSRALSSTCPAWRLRPA